MGLFQQPPPDRFLTLLIRSGHPDRGRGRPQWGSARSCLKPSPGRFAAFRGPARTPQAIEAAFPQA